MGGGGERYSEVKRGYNRLSERKRREEGDRWMEIVKKRQEGRTGVGGGK